MLSLLLIFTFIKSISGNDLPCDATDIPIISLPDSQTFTFSTVGATLDNNIGLPTNECGITSIRGPGVWYRLTLPSGSCNGPSPPQLSIGMHMSDCDYDAFISVFTMNDCNTPSGAVCVAFNDDETWPGDICPLIVPSSIQGCFEELYILVHAYDDSHDWEHGRVGSGTVDITIECSENCVLPDENGCTTSTDYNVQFLIDESGSVGSSGYELSIDLVQDLIQDDISPSAKISVFEFATYVQIIYGFNDTQSPRTNMINVIEAAYWDPGATATATAVQIGIDEWNRAINDGDISADDNKLLILMTDGRPNHGGDPCSKKAALDALDITVIIIGVGIGFSRSDVECLAVNDRDSIIEIDSFTQEAFDAVETQIATETCPDDEIGVPEDPLPCREAQEYCKNTYGSNLATIRTDADRAEAVAAFSEAGEAFGWIGLYSDDVETKWQFRSSEECPSNSHYKCVDFWIEAPGGVSKRPRCIGPSENGHECAVFYRDANGVNNDIPIDVPLPFLCD